MPDEKISQLPLTASVNTDDTFEKSLHNAAPSERMTAAQLATFMQTAMALLQLSGGNIKFNADGSGSMGKQNFADGTLSLLDALTGSNMIVLSGNDGSGNFAQGKSTLNADGGARFASGVVTISDLGVTTVLQLFLSDNTASLTNGNLQLGANGADGLAQLSSSGGTLTISLEGADGRASFANGQNTIDAAGNISIASVQVVTAQQPAIADATNAVDVITQFNTLLAELRTHGLIAT